MVQVARPGVRPQLLLPWNGGSAPPGRQPVAAARPGALLVKGNHLCHGGAVPWSAYLSCQRRWCPPLPQPPGTCRPLRSHAVAACLADGGQHRDAASPASVRRRNPPSAQPGLLVIFLVKSQVASLFPPRCREPACLPDALPCPPRKISASQTPRSWPRYYSYLLAPLAHFDTDGQLAFLQNGSGVHRRSRSLGAPERIHRSGRTGSPYPRLLLPFHQMVPHFPYG